MVRPIIAVKTIMEIMFVSKGNFIAELKRRNVIRMAGLYIVGAWLILQVSETLLPIFDTPNWVLKLLVYVLFIGFIPAVVMAWIFELTPDGLKRDEDVVPEQSIAPQTARKMERMIIALFAFALIFFAFDKFVLAPQREAALVVETTQTVQAVAKTEAKQVALDNSIAVLPFVNMSDDASNQYFSDGISEELLNVLVRVDDLSVASRTSSFAYRDKKMSSMEIAKELNVGNILEGSVRKSGNKVRITAQLIDAKNDRHIWSETYDRELTDIFAIQDEIANAIVKALQGTLANKKATSVVHVKADTENMQAYELYLKARELFIARSDLKESVRLYEQVVKMDPNFARGWEGLAAVYSVVESWGINDRDYNSLVKPAAERALQLDPSLSMPWAALSMAEQNKQVSDWATALELSNKAIQADPKNATAYLWRSIIWLNLGFFDKAIADQDSCHRFDPAYKNCIRWKAQSLIYTGDENKALALFEQGVAAGFVTNRANSFVPAMVRNGDTLAARLILKDINVSAEFSTILIAALSKPAASKIDATALLAKFGAQNTKSSGIDLSPRIVYLWLGDFDAVGEHASDTESTNDEILSWEPARPGWRNSAGFKQVLRKSGVFDYWQKHGYPPQCHAVGNDDFTCDAPKTLP
jgi:adenylate cyclase